MQIQTLKKIKARKKLKEVLNSSKITAKKAKAQIRYSAADKEVKRSTRKDRRNFVDYLARQAGEAAGKGDSKELCSITKTLRRC